MFQCDDFWRFGSKLKCGQRCELKLEMGRMRSHVIEALNLRQFTWAKHMNFWPAWMLPSYHIHNFRPWPPSRTRQFLQIATIPPRNLKKLARTDP
jgi:hypothetical protein